VQFINRTEELGMLRDRLSRPSAELLVVYGRRRVGKTELLAHLASDMRSLYFEATDTVALDQLRDFTAELARVGGSQVLAAQPLGALRMHPFSGVSTKKFLNLQDTSASTTMQHTMAVCTYQDEIAQAGRIAFGHLRNRSQMVALDNILAGCSVDSGVVLETNLTKRWIRCCCLLGAHQLRSALSVAMSSIRYFPFSVGLFLVLLTRNGHLDFTCLSRVTQIIEEG